jgi:uncharacterized protein (TIGR02246 family)
MKQFIRVTFALITATIFVEPFAAGAENSNAEEAIRRTADSFTEAYNQGNAKALAALWTEDGEYAIGPTKVKGRDAIAKLYAEFFRGHPGSKMKVKIDSIRLLAPTVAIEQGTASVTGSQNGPPSESTYTAIHIKQDDKWLMVGVRDSEAPTIKIDRDLKELDWLVGEWAAVKDGARIALKCGWMSDKHFLRAEITAHGGKGDLPGGTQIIGRNPQTGEILSWFFSADGGYGTGIWQKDNTRWFVHTEGMAADGTPTAALNILYQADKNVLSWQSTNRVLGDTRLPDIKEVVIERENTKK